MSGLDINRFRNKTVTFRLSPEEFLLLHTRQKISGKPKGQFIIEAILEGKTEGWTNDSSTIEGQFRPVPYPAPGYSKVKLYYKYGGSHFGTMVETNRYAHMYKSPELEFVVN